MAGLVAFLVGVPLTSKAFGADVVDIIVDSIALGVDASGES